MFLLFAPYIFSIIFFSVLLFPPPKTTLPSLRSAIAEISGLVFPLTEYTHFLKLSPSMFQWLFLLFVNKLLLQSEQVLDNFLGRAEPLGTNLTFCTWEEQVYSHGPSHPPNVWLREARVDNAADMSCEDACFSGRFYCKHLFTQLSVYVPNQNVPP